MRTMLAVDGSTQSEEAAKALADLAHAERLVVLHVVDVPSPAYPMMMPEVAQTLYTATERSMKEEGEAVLKRVASMLPQDTGPVSTRLEVGSPAEHILRVADEERADLIVMGTRGVSAVQEIVLGSVAHRVVTHAKCPALIVNAPVTRIHSVLLAVEGANDADRALEFLSRKPFRHSIELTVLTVLPWARPLRPVGVSDAQIFRENASKSAWCFVWDVAARLSGFGYLAGALVGMGTPANAILQQAAAVKPDVIMLGSHGKLGVTRFLLGSVSHSVLHGAACPVLVFR